LRFDGLLSSGKRVTDGEKDGNFYVYIYVRAAARSMMPFEPQTVKYKVSVRLIGGGTLAYSTSCGPTGNSTRARPFVRR